MFLQLKKVYDCDYKILEMIETTSNSLLAEVNYFELCCRVLDTILLVIVLIMKGDNILYGGSLIGFESSIHVVLIMCKKYFTLKKGIFTWQR